MTTATIAWPTEAELRDIYDGAGELSGTLEDLAMRVRRIQEESDGGSEPSFVELGVLTKLVTTIECDLVTMRDSVKELARARDTAAPHH